MLELKHISKMFDQRKILDDISLVFPDVGLIGIQGRSGCGKSTLLSIISGLEKQYEGTVLFQGKSIIEHKSFQKKYLSYMLQYHDYIGSMTVYENIVLACHIGGIQADKKEIMKLAKRLNMEDYLYSFCCQLSGGQIQRMSIMKALMKKSQILLCDEPTGSLHRKQALEVMELLQEISQDILVVVVSHDTHLLTQYCDTVMTLNNGKLSGQMIENHHDLPMMITQPRSLWFYTFRQMLSQKNKLIFLFAFQWIMITATVLMLAGIAGIQKAIKESEHSVQSQVMTIQKKNNEPFLHMPSHSLFLSCDYYYSMNHLYIQKKSQNIDASFYIMPKSTQHIKLQWGRIPTHKYEVLVSHSLYQQIKQNDIQIGTLSGNFRIVGVSEAMLFEGMECYMHKDILEDLQEFKDESTLRVEVKDGHARELYDHYDKNMIIYNEVIERSNQYQTLVKLAQTIALIFIVMSSIISLLLIGIVESIIQYDRLHDYAYLKSLGISARHFFMLTMIEACLMSFFMIFGGFVLAHMSYLYVNEIFDLKKKMLFELSLPVYFHLRYGLYVLIAIAYVMMNMLATLYPYWKLKSYNVVELLKED